MSKKHTLDFLKRLAGGLTLMFGNQCEVVIRNMNDSEMTIIYSENKHITGKDMDDVLSAINLENREVFVSGRDVINAKVVTKNNRTIKASLFHVRGNDYHYMININYDSTHLFLAQSILNELSQAGQEHKVSEEQNNSVTNMLEQLYEEAVAYIGKPVPIMKKKERVEMIRYLNDKGAFSIHKGIPIISKKMNLSRYTIYNYLKEIKK